MDEFGFYEQPAAVSVYVGDLPAVVTTRTIRRLRPS